MIRPHPQIDATNQAPALRRHLEKMLPRFTVLPGLVGLTLNGGLARGYVDHLSEIDLTFYLTPDAFKRWQYEKSPVALGITMLNGQLYDIKHVNYAAEQEREWDEVMRWDASYAEILYDPDHLLRKLFAEKLAEGPDLSQVEGLLMRCWWHFELAGEIWIHRGDVVQGHHMFNQAVVSLAQALFVANGEYVPHEKWLFHMSRSLAWQPPDWKNRLVAAISTGDLTMESLKRRQEVIRRLWEEVDDHTRKEHYPHLPVHVMQKRFYEQLKLLAEVGSMSISEWQAKTGREVPNQDPFHPVIKVEKGKIFFVPEAVPGIGREDMYAWHRAILQAAVAGQSQDD